MICVRFAGNDDDRSAKIFRREQTISEVDPIFERPIFLFAAAAGMKRDDWSRAMAEKSVGRVSILGRRIKLRRQIIDAKTESLEWPQKLSGCVLATLDLARAMNQIIYAAPAQIHLKDAIGIVKIADDQIEAREIVCEFGREFRILREEARERSVLD